MSRPWLSRTTRCALAVLALAPVAATQATTVYRGAARAIDYMHPNVEQGGTTGAPMNYTAALSGIEATSHTDGAAGGSADVMATAGPNSGAGADAGITYRVELTGPAGVYVPIHIVASGYVDARILGPGSVYGATSSFIVNFSTATEERISGYVTISPGLTGSFVVDQIVRVYAGSFFDVDLEVSAGAGSPGGEAAYAHAFVDPVFTIDPAFASLYRLVGIPGVGAEDPPPPPTTGVPEPETWAIGLLGSIVLAGARRRRRD